MAGRLSGCKTADVLRTIGLGATYMEEHVYSILAIEGINVYFRR